MNAQHGGQRVLIAAEPADRLTIIDAQTYSSRQVCDFFGEIGGIDFTPDGSNIVVANMDAKVGGLMWYERVGLFDGEKQRDKVSLLEARGWDVDDIGDLEWDKTVQVWGDRGARGISRGSRALELGEGSKCLF
jgi:DNA-binding beta-propeller fold protein YncE